MIFIQKPSELYRKRNLKPTQIKLLVGLPYINLIFFTFYIFVVTDLNFQPPPNVHSLLSIKKQIFSLIYISFFHFIFYEQNINYIFVQFFLLFRVVHIVYIPILYVIFIQMFAKMFPLFRYYVSAQTMNKKEQFMNFFAN